MSIKMEMLKNNYPQSYPRVENMLVNTNYCARQRLAVVPKAGPNSPGMKQRPRSEDLGAL